MSNNTYNGCATFETWLILSRCFYGEELEAFTEYMSEVYSRKFDFTASDVQEYTESIVTRDDFRGSEDLAVDLALYFLDGVDWDQIAQKVNEYVRLTRANKRANKRR